MDLVKKNIPIIICVVVIIAAIVADVIPLGGFREELKTKATARAGEYDALNSILNKKRTLPIVDPGTTEAQPLDVFPTQAVIDMGKAVTEQVAGSSNTLLDNVVKRTERKPLVPGALPSPQFVEADQFKRAYQREIDMSPAGRANSLPVRVMKAGFAPTNEDLDAERQKRVTNIQQTVAVIANGQVTNPQQVEQAVQAEVVNLQTEMVRKAADEALVYINPDAMDVQQALIGAAGQPEPSVIFWAQLGLWAQEDLFQGIRQINDASGAKNVAGAPIKHLIKVDVIEQFVGIGAAASADPNNPTPAPPSDPNAAITPSYAKTPSGRVSNGLFDVIHMQVSMVVEADKLPLVLDQLGRGRLLTVIEVSRVDPLDTAVAANAGYFFGDKPVVRVDMLVEDLFLRKWTEQYMPERIKQMLGIQPAPAAPPGG